LPGTASRACVHPTRYNAAESKQGNA